jgi:predicted nucleotidyltransferase component of viral defense system
MLDLYYLNSLYPLQDYILKIINSCKTDFYLTGGTALSRVYTKHRYSDDLDFFVNQSPAFKEQVSTIIDLLNTYNSFAIKVLINEDSFVRLMIEQNSVFLKVEFINDVGFRVGNLVSTSLFTKTDNPMNILSNKICALSRKEGKDISDIIEISRKFQFNWVDIFNDAKQKDNWIDEIKSLMLIDQFTDADFKKVKWIMNPDLNLIYSTVKQIKMDIVSANTNSVFEG